jgi:hypothetical protein
MEAKIVIVGDSNNIVGGIAASNNKLVDRPSFAGNNTRVVDIAGIADMTGLVDFVDNFAYLD